MDGECKLCGGRAKLIRSHTVPKFVYKWIKESSGMPEFMMDLVSRRVIQDERRTHVLCEKCELLFSKDEKRFREEIFIPFHSGERAVFEYGSWLKRFLAGLHWRVLIDDTKDFSPPPEIKELYRKAEETLRAYLLTESSNIRDYEFHICFLGLFTESRVPEGTNYYLGRAIDTTPAFNDDGEAFVFAKIAKIATTCLLTPSTDVWLGTNVNNSGQLSLEQQISSHFVRFLIDRAKLAKSRSFQVSDHQRRRVESYLKQKPDSLRSSDVYQVERVERQRQVRVQQRELLRRMMSGKQRNHACPCGSGRKYKNCCGKPTDNLLES